MSKSIGSRIAQKRDAKGLTREQLAKKAKITGGFLATVENELAGMSPELAERLGKALGMRITPDDITKHNRKATAYRAGLKANKPKAKAVKSVPAPKSAPKSVKAQKSVEASGQYQLPGIAEMVGAEIRLQVQDMVRSALQRGLAAQSVETEETIDYTPRFTAVK